MDQITPRVELRLVFGSDRFNTQDDSWLDQEGELLRAMADAGVPVTHAAGSGEPGSKGLFEAFLMALTSAQAIRSAAECWRAWLARDDSRRIEVTRTVGGATHSVVLTGSRFPDEDLARLLHERPGSRPDVEEPSA